MFNVNLPGEAVAEVNTTDAPFDIEALFRTHYGRIARIIQRVVRDRGRSEELAVEVFLKLWRNHKAQYENVEAWLYRVAVRVGIDELRRQTRRAHYEHLLKWVRPRPHPATPEQLHSAVEQQNRVREVLSALDPRQAQFLLLRSQEFTYDEVAAILNISVKTVDAQLVTAFKKITEAVKLDYATAF